ncbi:helix-turn-helix transcriptional regulator [Sporosarcina sp. Te-1]|uniref:helix-turn-helix transcriptional regulator n=1 Tax=Sporosarcina sp. Te-1 TaxID=2818390 RepID=UPI001A9F2FB1|nr:helix-turn-helix transcriptional regulator [Sporosarcina sp. Te-1]QTD42526.1 helix-turn-helix transcriptional regulator [Sporosarcina sp. Te-1]
MGIGSKIRYLRSKSNLTQKELALGVCDTSYLSKIENDIVVPSDEMLGLFCLKLGLETTDLKQEVDLLRDLQLNATDLHRTIRKGSIESAIVLYNDIIAKSRMNISPAMQVFKVLFGLRIALMKKEREEAVELYQETIKLQEYVLEWMKPYYNRYSGLFHYMYGSLKKSLFLYKEAEKHVPVDEIEDVYYQLALVHHLLGEYSMSTYYEEKALELFARKMDYEQCVNCQLLLGINYRKMGNLEQAKETYLSILEKVVPLRNREVIAKVYHNLGLVYSDEGKSSEAIMAFETSLGYRDDDNARMKTCYTISKEFLRIGDGASAAECVKVGGKIAESVKDEEHMIKFQVIKYKLDKKKQNPILEYYITTVALPYFEERSDHQMIKEYIHELVLYYEECRQYKSALAYLKKLL